MKIAGKKLPLSFFYVSSLRVPDANCNVGYRHDGHSPSRQEVKTIEQASADKSRTPAIWQAAGQPIPTGYKVSSREVWMVADTSTPLPDITVDQAQVHISAPLPTKDGADVFEDVYCRGKGAILAIPLFRMNTLKCIVAVYQILRQGLFTFG